MYRNRFLTALVIALALAGSARAQRWFPEVELRTLGEVVWSTTIEGDLDRDIADRQYKLVLLPTEYTGQGHRIEVDYQMIRTRTNYPYWDACARIDAPCANGQVWTRAHAVHFKDSVTGSWFFHGEDHEEARPHRVRITFSQPASFPYWFRATIRIRRTPTTNIGGPVRERPEWVRTGTAAAPSWMSGDLAMPVQNHRWMLFSLEPGQQLRVKSRVGADGGAHTFLYAPMYDLNHRLISQPAIYINATGTSDTALRTNTKSEREWLIIGFRSGGAIKSFELGFYSPQGASPPVGETVAAPCGTAINPYEVVGREVKSWQGAGGAAYTLTPPGAGEMLRLRVRVLKTAWMGAGTGAMATYKVLAEDGTQLGTNSAGSDPFGLTYGETYFELDDTTAPNRHPARVDLTTAYAAHDLVVDVVRYRRVR